MEQDIEVMQRSVIATLFIVMTGVRRMSGLCGRVKRTPGEVTDDTK